MNLPLLLAQTATENSGINWHTFFFLLFALVSCGMALAVLFSSNIVRMAFYLTVSLGAVSGLFILAGAHFVGAMQLMIYVGGTLVLLIFGVMLTSQAQFIEMKTRGGEWIMAALVGGSMLAVLLWAAFKVDVWHPNTDADFIASRQNLHVEQDTTSLGAALMGLRNDSLSEENSQLKRGMSGYFIHFEIVSVHLLVVLIGAAFLARARHSVGDSIPRTAAPVRTDRRRGLFMSILLFAAALIALAKAVASFYVYGTGDVSLFGELPLANAENWLWLATGILQLLAAFALIAIMRWQQWGFYALCVLVVVISALVFGAGAGTGMSLAALGGGVVALGILFFLLSIGGRRSIWAQME